MQSLCFHGLITKEREKMLNFRFGFTLSELITAGSQTRSLKSFIPKFTKKWRHRHQNPGSFNSAGNQMIEAYQFSGTN
jgi:hypothetical protein